MNSTPSNENKVNEIVVIGAGIIGTSVAERLQHEGKQVLLLDREAPGMGCSHGNAGHFATDFVLPLANFKTLLSVPKLLLDPMGPLTLDWRYLLQLTPWLLRYAWAAMPHNATHTINALKQLNRPAIERYSALLQRTKLSDLMTCNGALTVYHSEKAAKQNLKHLQTVKAHGVNVVQLSANAIKELEPHLNDAIYGGLFYPDTAHSINPYRLVTSLFEYFIEQGGLFKQLNVSHIDTSQVDKIVIRTNGKSIAAKQVIIAAGAFSKPLVKQLGYKVPLETERGYHLMLPQEKSRITRPISSFEHSFVMTPMEKGLRLAGTVELAGLKTAPNWKRAEILFTHAQKLMDGLNQEQVERWMGHRPSLPDSLPVIDRAKNNRNVMFAFGHQHLGLTQAAVTADYISDLVFERGNQNDLSAFRIDRF